MAEEQTSSVNWFEWATEGLCILIIGVIGLAGNGISIWTFSRQKVHRIFHNLLLVLALFDIVYVACSIHLFSLKNFWSGYNQASRLPSLPILIPIAQIGLMGSVYCTVALALERFLAVCYPFLPRRHVYSTRTFVVPVLVFTIVYNVPKFFELTLDHVPVDHVNQMFQDHNMTLEQAMQNFTWSNYHGPVQIELKPTPLRLNRLYIRVYILWMNLIVQILGPFLVLIILNIRVYKRIKQFEQALNNNALRVCFTRNPSTINGHGERGRQITTRQASARGPGRRSGGGGGGSSSHVHLSPNNGSAHHHQTDSLLSGTTNRSSISSARSTSGLASSPYEQPSVAVHRFKSTRLSESEEIIESLPSGGGEVGGDTSGRSGRSVSSRQSRRSGCTANGSDEDHQDNISRELISGRKKSPSFHTPRRREVQLSKISIYIVFMFVICHSVRLIPNTYEMIYTYSSDYETNLLPWPAWVAKITNLSHVLLTLVCSSNFFIYYFKHGAVCKRRSKRANAILSEAGNNGNHNIDDEVELEMQEQATKSSITGSFKNSKLARSLSKGRWSNSKPSRTTIDV